MATKRRAQTSPYHHGDLRRALLEASVELIEEVGADALKLREVAKRTGVSHAAPYRHFASKEELLSAVAAAGFELLARSVALAAARAPSVDQQLVRAAVAYVEFARKRPAYFEVMFRTGRRPGAPLADASTGAFQGLVGLVEAAQAAGVLPAEEPSELARAAWALAHGLAELAISGRLGVRGQKELSRVTARSAQALVQGLALDG